MLLSIGILCRDLGQLDEALRNYEVAVELNRATGNHAAEGTVLMNRGTTLCQQGRLHEAHADFVQALSIAREVRDQRLEASTLEALGVLFGQEGRFEEARGALAQAIEIGKEVGEPAAVGRILATRADCERRAGAVASGYSFLVEAESLADEVGASIDSELRRHLARVRRALEVHDDHP